MKIHLKTIKNMKFFKKFENIFMILGKINKILCSTFA